MKIIVSGNEYDRWNQLKNYEKHKNCQSYLNFERKKKTGEEVVCSEFW